VIGLSSSASPEPRISLPVLVAAAAPVCLVTLGVIVFSLFELSGRTLSSEGPPRNIAEAAALNGDSTVMRLLKAGEDPARVVDVRPFAISSAVRRVSGVEAAVWAQSLELITLFDRAGAIGEGEKRRTLACLAADLGHEDIVEYLAPNGAPECEAGRAVAEVEARTPREQ
jgi:hypothetical protein